jgi:polyisoprenoid-binding protein YceI
LQSAGRSTKLPPFFAGPRVAVAGAEAHLKETVSMATERWTIDTSHSSVDFVIRHMVVSKVRGTFTDWSGTIDLDKEVPSNSSVSAKIVVASLDTRDKKRDAHLISDDFFGADKHPWIEFSSNRIEGDATAESFKIIGQLSIRDQTHEITLDGDFNGLNQDPWGNTRIHYSAKTTIKRGDFGLGWNQVLEAGGVLIGETVTIEIEIEAVKTVQPEATAT